MAIAQEPLSEPMAVSDELSSNTVTTNTDQSSFLDLFRIRNFRIMWIGESISLLGDQFYLIALPWLVLQITGDAFAMGAVLAIGSIPRALFMLVGGALTDRYSPRNVMLMSNIIRMILVALLTVIVLTGMIEVWMLLLFALAFGLADAFFVPAQSSIVPQVINKEQLQTGNAIVQGTMQLSLFLGPVVAGLLIALLSGAPAEGVEGGNMTGVGIAFGIDALTFLASAIALWMLRISPVENTEDSNSSDGVFGLIRDGLVSIWNDHTLRLLFLLIGAANLFIMGPLLIGVPVLADTRFPEGAAAYGILMSAFGGGSLVGILMAGMLPKPSARGLGIILATVWSAMGICIALIGLIESTPLAALALLGMGAANGYVTVLFITWLQTRTPSAMLGRVMSVLSFASLGLLPVSQALSGAFIDLNVTWFFIVAGLGMTVLVLLSLLSPSLRQMGVSKPQSA